jgi:hypothetical protein
VKAHSTPEELAEIEAKYGRYSQEYSLAFLGPEVMAAIAASVAAAPLPSPEKVALIARLFAAADPPPGPA